MIKPIMQTSKGCTVSGCQTAYNPRLNSYSEISGRVRVVEGNPFFDQIVRWDLNGYAINHELGDIVWGADGVGDYQLRQGENVFRF